MRIEINVERRGEIPVNVGKGGRNPQKVEVNIMINKIRLKDLVAVVSNDVTLCVIKEKNGTEKYFSDISHLAEQFKCDYITSFNISYNYYGERALVVTLEHC